MLSEKFNYLYSQFLFAIPSKNYYTSHPSLDLRGEDVKDDIIDWFHRSFLVKYIG